MNDAHVVRVGNGDAYLLDDLARINLMLQEEGGDTCFCFTVDDGPVDGGSSTILGQEGGVQVEGAQTGHVPHHFGQHAESHHNLQVGLPGAQGVQKLLVFQLLRLEQG